MKTSLLMIFDENEWYLVIGRKNSMVRNRSFLKFRVKQQQTNKKAKHFARMRKRNISAASPGKYGPKKTTVESRIRRKIKSFWTNLRRDLKGLTVVRRFFAERDCILNTLFFICGRNANASDSQPEFSHVSVVDKEQQRQGQPPRGNFHFFSRKSWTRDITLVRHSSKPEFSISDVLFPWRLFSQTETNMVSAFHPCSSIFLW